MNKKRFYEFKNVAENEYSLYVYGEIVSEKWSYSDVDVTDFKQALADIPNGAKLNMYVNSGQTKIKRLIAFREKAPYGGESGMPCGACREFLYQLNKENENMEILVDYESRKTVTLKTLLPDWWGEERSETKSGASGCERD